MFKFIKTLALLVPQLKKLKEERDNLKYEREWLISRFGFVPPGHYYSPIASIESIKEREKELYGQIPERITSVNLNVKKQKDNLMDFAHYYKELPFREERNETLRYYFNNPSYGFCDGIFLYSMMRKLRPSRIIEIGCGYTSGLMMDVNDIFFGNSIEITFIDPYPELLLSVMKVEDQERYRILAEEVQKIELALFESLGYNDILFIDSSHVSKIGSDVNFLLHLVLPSLKEGVVIHFHDVFYPFEYPKEWIFEGKFWNEIYLLRAFLQYNRSFEVEFFNDYMAIYFEKMLSELMPLCLRRRGAGFWMRKMEGPHDGKF